jgi:hypothetical protein
MSLPGPDEEFADEIAKAKAAEHIALLYASRRRRQAEYDQLNFIQKAVFTPPRQGPLSSIGSFFCYYNDDPEGLFTLFTTMKENLFSKLKSHARLGFDVLHTLKEFPEAIVPQSHVADTLSYDKLAAHCQRFFKFLASPEVTKLLEEESALKMHAVERTLMEINEDLRDPVSLIAEYVGANKNTFLPAAMKARARMEGEEQQKYCFTRAAQSVIKIVFGKPQ